MLSKNDNVTFFDKFKDIPVNKKSRLDIIEPINNILSPRVFYDILHFCVFGI